MVEPHQGATAFGHFEDQGAIWRCDRGRAPIGGEHHACERPLDRLPRERIADGGFQSRARHGRTRAVHLDVEELRRRVLALPRERTGETLGHLLQLHHVSVLLGVPGEGRAAF
jgi:hypothetical protein